MAITFTEAPLVAPGDPIASDQLAALARAVNDRLRSGLGDGAWRIFFWFYALFRQLRNPTADGLLWPPSGEFFEAFQSLEPADGQWPLAGPGEPEGVNLGSQLGAFAFGTAALGVDAEDVRLATLPLLLNGQAPQTAWDWWTLAKLQRGARDPNTGATGCPAWDAARAHGFIAFSRRSPHGNSWGGFLPGPEIDALNPCQDPDAADEYAAPPNWQLVFTSLTGAPAKTYSTCQPGPDVVPANAYDSHVAAVGDTPWAYYVFKNDGSVEVLDKALWIEGPYTSNPALSKQPNGALSRIQQAFVREFRGTQDQRDAGPWLAHAADFQRFFTTQYHLAPQLGMQSGDEITALYPAWETASGLPAQTWLPSASGGAEHIIADGHVAASFAVVARHLAAPITLECFDGEERLAVIRLDPGAPESSALHLLPAARPAARLRFRCAESLALGAGGALRVEATELLAYQPQLADAYAVLRLGAASYQGVDDGSGVRTTNARELLDRWFQTGAAFDQNGGIGLPGSLAEINGNAVFEAARRLSRCVRLVPRRNFIGYEVINEAGVAKSVLVFERFAAMPGIASVDLFEGLAGAIAHEAPAEGLTNEWLLGLELKPYHPSLSSIWKPDGWGGADHWPLSDRCHFYSPDIANDAALRSHLSYGARFFGAGNPGVPYAEAPAGYRYTIKPEAPTANANTINCAPGDADCEAWRLNFYRSCRLYEAWPEIDRAEALRESGVEIVRVVLKSRVHHCATAPATIPRDVNSWDLAALAAEPHRSWENGLREYLAHVSRNHQCTQQGPTGVSGQPGNAAANSDIDLQADQPFGSCYPHFVFCQLIPEPRADDNDSPDPSDTPLWHDPFPQMEVYLRAMCEGFVDGQLTASQACDYATTDLYDFTWPNLVFQATGGTRQWFSSFPLTVRKDNPEGHGPLPNTEAYADVFNQFSAAVNLLDTVRVMLPLKLRCRPWTGATDHGVMAVLPDLITEQGCSPPAGTPSRTLWRGLVPEQAAATPGAWGDCVTGDLVASASGDFFVGGGGGNCMSGLWRLTSSRADVEYAVELNDPDAAEAIPPTWRDMIASQAEILGVQATTATESRVSEVAPGLGDDCGALTDFWSPGPGGGPLAWTETSPTTTWCGLIGATGKISAPPVGYQELKVGHDGAPIGTNYCYGAAGNLRSLAILSLSTLALRIPLVPQAPGA